MKTEGLFPNTAVDCVAIVPPEAFEGGEALRPELIEMPGQREARFNAAFPAAQHALIGAGHIAIQGNRICTLELIPGLAPRLDALQLPCAVALPTGPNVRIRAANMIGIDENPAGP